MKIFISAGEPSGDLHGANLIRSLKQIDSSIEFIGFGGEKMQSAGCQLIYPLTQLAVMWFLRVFLNIFTFIGLLNKAKKYFQTEKPDAVILIDYPGFHFALAKRASAAGIPVYYFVPPQLWAWAGWRVKKMQKWVTHILCSLPFEAEWYQKRGVSCTYVGHPFFDELPHQNIDNTFVQNVLQSTNPVIGILPGSRKQEVTKNLSSLLDTATIIHQQHPEVTFAVASYNQIQADIANQMIAKRDLPVKVYLKKTPEIISNTRFCLSVSGSVSLELMYRLTPAIILYQLNWVSLRVGRFFMKCRYITLVNLLANEELYPEFLTDHNPSKAMAAKAMIWLNEPEKISELKQKLEKVRSQVAIPGACDRAANAIMQQLLQLGTKPHSNQRSAA